MVRSDLRGKEGRDDPTKKRTMASVDYPVMPLGGERLAVWRRD